MLEIKIDNIYIEEVTSLSAEDNNLEKKLSSAGFAAKAIEYSRVKVI